MNKTLWIVGGVAVLGIGGFFAFKYYKKAKATGAQSNVAPTTPSNKTVGGNWWDKLGQIGNSLGSTVNALESTANQISGWNW